MAEQEQQIVTTAQEQAPDSAEASTKIMGTLMHVQELFYNMSSFKDGPNAGKVNKEQLKDILLRSEQFDFTDQDPDIRAIDYMKLLDTDKDNLVGFFDFLQPILHVVPAEVITAFTQDQRFRQETFNDLRLCFDACKQTVGGVVQADITLIRAKFVEKGTEQAKQLTRAMDQLLALINVPQSQATLNTTLFHTGILRLEKRTLLTFTSKLYMEEEQRLLGIASARPERFVPDHALKSAVATAIEDPATQLADAKSLLRQMQDKVQELETRLTDYEDTNQTISPAQLPQAQAKPQDLWKRFRRALPSFMDVVLDTSAAIHDNSYLTMSDDVQKKVITDLNSEIDHTRQFKNRYEKIVDQLAKANSEEQKAMTPNTVNVINKNLVKQRNDKQKQINEQNREIRNIKNQNRVYKEFSDGKISKTDLRVIIDKSEREQNEFAQVKLRKIKVERIRNEATTNETDDNNEPKSMSQLLSMFGGQKATQQTQPAFINQKTVVEEGNVAPGRAFKPKQRRVNETGEELFSDSSDQEEEIAEELHEEQIETTPAAPSMSFIQTMFDSQIKRNFEEATAKQVAGLSAFKSTGNAMRDGFRRMIEQKMKEKVQAELAKKHEEDAVFKREVEIRTAHREQEIEDEKKRLIAENEIKLKTANEARQDAEVMAKTATVAAMVGAATQTGVQVNSEVVSEDPKVLAQRMNQLLNRVGQIALTMESMRAFDLVWSDPTISRFSSQTGQQSLFSENFAQRIQQDQAYRQQVQESLMQLYLARDSEETGILKDDAALAFIEDAFSSLQQNQSTPMNVIQKSTIYEAVQSLDPTYEGFNLDDFVRALQTLAAFNTEGRTQSDLPAELQNLSDEQKLQIMIATGFSETKTHIDQIRNEIEVSRLELLAERQHIEAERSELEFDKKQLADDKQEFEANGAKLVAATAGQALLVENEVKKRLKEEKAREEFERNAKAQGGIDHDLRALQTFAELRERQQINYDDVQDDDALADAMLAADDLEKKKLLMRYKRLKQEVLQRDAAFTNKVMRNYFTCIRKVGTLWKKSEGFFNRWQQRFVVLSNAGLIYFKVDNMTAKDDLEPQNFKPLNDFVLVEVPESESKKPHTFRIIFCKSSIVKHPMLVAAPTHHDMKEWINAFRMHQIDTMESRSKFFEKKLERSGVRVPRASILMTQGLNAPLQTVQAKRTMSAGPSLMPTLSMVGDRPQRTQTMGLIAEDEKEEDEPVAKKGIIPQEVLFQYFGQGRGRADPLRHIFAYHGQPFRKVDVESAEWEAKKARGEGGEFGGGLPQTFVTENGTTTNMGQFGATLRSFGVRYGYFDPRDWAQCRYIDPVVESWGDLQNALGGVFFAPEDAKAAAMEKYLGFAKSFHGLIEKNMAHHGGRFAAGNKVTIADFVMASYIDNILKNTNSPFFEPSKSIQPSLETYIATLTAEFEQMRTNPCGGPF